ncbi:hypothetical protein BGZ93_001069 [Podila epicladia]|nr:hypothetical protein BGZ93_001069 [Podila epicladia]
MDWAPIISVAGFLYGLDAHSTTTAVRSTTEPVQEGAADPGREEEELEESQVKKGTIEEELRQQSISNSDESGEDEEAQEAPLSSDDPAFPSLGTSSKRKEYSNPNCRKNKRIRDIKKGKHRHRRDP